MAIVLAIDLLVFLVLFAWYIHERKQTQNWPAAFHFASGLLTVALTLFVLSGSFTMHYAIRYQLNKGYAIAERLVVATIAVLGSALILIGMEWARLVMILEVTLTSNPWGVPMFSVTYFVLTGFFALHLLAGMVYLTVLGAKIQTVDAGAAALLIHATNAMWLVLFVGLYLASTDLQGI